MDITHEEFERLTDLIYRRIGVRFEPKKIYFVGKRVEKRIDKMGFETPSEYIRFLRFSDGSGLEFQNLVNLLTVNETYFFRDYPQLQTFADHCLSAVVEKKLASGDRTLRIWSAGCSSGEEPYTLAIILAEMLEDLGDWQVKILASDIDENILARAETGVYDKRSVKEVPPEYLERHFQANPRGDYFRIAPHIKSMVNFEHLNLADRFALRRRSSYDFIFCRNVLIYFDETSRRQVVDHFYLALNRGGYIFLGSSESVGRITTAFKLKRSDNRYLVYCKE